MPFPRGKVEQNPWLKLNKNIFNSLSFPTLNTKGLLLVGFSLLAGWSTQSIPHWNTASTSHTGVSTGIQSSRWEAIPQILCTALRDSTFHGERWISPPWPLEAHALCSAPSSSAPCPLHSITRAPLISVMTSGNAFCLQQLIALPLTCWDQLLSCWEKRIKNEPWE